ncbi:MAG: dihydrolipoamide acetyltransferase family protein [Bacteroidota bacterium]|jgi:pyruvate dehydrogenase E2 component (dihydrolipoamide acetyltransferase)|nr:dihydrolipoamide acetyltransferase family protein [Bacteroidota bacterium]
MAVLVIMPKQGQSVESCIITELKKKVGDPVKKGEVLFSYETDKASFEEESPADGTILAIFAGEGDEVPVLDRMMIIGEEGEDISELLGEGAADVGSVSESAAPASGLAPAASAAVSPATVGTASSVAADAGGEAPFKASVSLQAGVSPASPRARKLAGEHALDATRLEGTGPGGRVIERDVKQALEERPKMTALAKKVASEEGLEPAIKGSGLAGRARAADLVTPVAVSIHLTGSAKPQATSPTPVVGIAPGEEYEDRKLSNIRKLIARSMHASLQNSAQLTHHLGADARRLLELRKSAKEALAEGRVDTNITLNDMVCFAVIKALKKFPNVNSHFLGDSIRLFKKVHLGLAVDTERGLMVPVIRDADDLSIIDLANRMKELAAACRTGSVNPDLLLPEVGSFTVSNLGNYGVEMFTPVINLPQSAILGVNTIVPRPKDLGNGVYAFVPYMGLSLTYDHRSLDGGEATRFLKQIAIEIETLQLDF